jgi:glyoxylase I family protein
MSITQFLHASLNVTDLHAARQFYETGLGFKTAERNLSFAGQWYQIGPLQLHLIVAQTVIKDRTNPEKWGRNRHLAFAVEDLSLVKQRLEELGYPFQASSSGRAALFVPDPDGNLIELTQELPFT